MLSSSSSCTPFRVTMLRATRRGVQGPTAVAGGRQCLQVPRSKDSSERSRVQACPLEKHTSRRKYSAGFAARRKPLRDPATRDTSLPPWGDGRLGAWRRPAQARPLSARAPRAREQKRERLKCDKCKGARPDVSPACLGYTHASSPQLFACPVRCSCLQRTLRRLCELHLAPLRSTSSSTHVKYGATLDAESSGRLVVTHLLAAEDESLLRRWDALLLLYALLDARDLCGSAYMRYEHERES